MSTTPFLHLRYKGTDCALMVTPWTAEGSDGECQHGDFEATFTKRSVCTYGRNCSPCNIIIVIAVETFLR